MKITFRPSCVLDSSKDMGEGKERPHINFTQGRQSKLEILLKLLYSIKTLTP